VPPNERFAHGFLTVPLEAENDAPSEMAPSEVHDEEVEHGCCLRAADNATCATTLAALSGGN
jgi:hypothetical protein